MRFEIAFSERADAEMDAIEANPAHKKRAKAVRKALAFLESNPRHPGLNTHKYSSLHGPNGEDIFEAYAENKTPGAYRIFFHYGPDTGMITIVTITKHP
ncbi:MAG: type II toxin-antitoxin system RelE family toxin [Bdellovibrionales bacterium]